MYPLLRVISSCHHCSFFFFIDTATTEIYTYLHTLSLHDALPISDDDHRHRACASARAQRHHDAADHVLRVRHQYERGRRSEEHTSELQSLMRISYAVFCLKKKKK